ncbi:MAG: molybdopterin-dependent oxidoreductase [Acidimicrobiales bacterium]
MSVAARSSEAFRAGEDAYRLRWSWDRVAWGTHCVDCYPGNCLYRVFVKDGMVVREEPAARHAKVEEGVPDFNPMGCNKGASWSQQLYDGDRIVHPLRRVGDRGGGKWERISWDEAATTIADALLDAIEEGGPETIVHEGTPEIATVVPTYRFFNTIGGRILDLHGSFNDFSVGLHETFGKFCPVSSADDWFHSELILVWHMNPAFTRIPLYHFMLEARYHGAEIVSISPDLNASHLHADYHVPVEVASDAALGLAMVQVILEEGLEDATFIREQTDLPMLVRTDTHRYLRETDVEATPGREDQLYHYDPEHGLVKAARGNLLLDGRAVALSGAYSVTLADGTTVEVEPVMQALRRHLDANYTPERSQAVTGVHPDVVRMLARKAATRRTNIMLGWNSCKYYHGDLIERAMCLLLAVTGNWGKAGTGIRSWSAGMFDGQGLATAKPAPGIEGTEALLQMRDSMLQSLRVADPTISDELAVRELNRLLIEASQLSNREAEGSATGSPMAWWWYWQAGYRERWNTPGWGDDSLPRTFDEYVAEALEKGWWAGVDSPKPDQPPKVLIECGGNMLRRTRGGKTALVDGLWDKFKLIVSIDFRLNFTGLHSDLVLPAAQHYEKVGFHIPTPHVMHLTFSDRAADPAGEAKPEWQIFQLILQAMTERAAARGIEEYRNARGNLFRPSQLWDKYTMNGYLADEEKLADEIIRDCAYAETLPEGTTIQTLRDNGQIRFTGWGMSPMALAQASPFETDRAHSPFRNHVELGQPFPTYARRAQFYIDHPWWLEAGEALPVHKKHPKAGGNHPLQMTSGHNRWSIHSMNQLNPVMLQTHRGEPLVEVSVEDAAERGVADDDLVRVWNDLASMRVRAKVSPGVKPGQIISYNGWDGHQYRDWMGANELEAGMVKWIGFAGGYGHIQYAPSEWQPIPSDRAVPCNFEKVEATK